MAFARYQRLTTEDKRSGLRRIESLRLGGETGVIASRVAALQLSDDAAWTLSGDELAAIDSTGDVVLFESNGPQGRHGFFTVHSLHALTYSDRTDLVFTLVPLAVSANDNGVLSVLENSARRHVHESLTLGGGWDSAPDGWQWRASPMSIGGVSLGGTSRAHSGAG